MKRRLSAEEAIDLLNKSVIERGEDWVYPADVFGGTCMYFVEKYFVHQDLDLSQYGLTENGPACLVGQALSFVGLTPDAGVIDFNDQDVEHLDMSIRDSDLDWRLSNGALGVLNVAQNCNDRSMPWGQCVTLAAQWWNEYEGKDWDLEAESVVEASQRWFNLNVRDK